MSAVYVCIYKQAEHLKFFYIQLPHKARAEKCNIVDERQFEAEREIPERQISAPNEKNTALKHGLGKLGGGLVRGQGPA